MIRPEARDALWRWREGLVGGLLLILGVTWALTSFGLLRWLGVALIIIAIALIAAGLQRARFRQGEGGQGVVDVDEGQVTYFGPLGGGAIALESLTRLELHPDGKPAHWALYQPGQPVLFIPVNAEGAEALFDVFTALPGMHTERVLAALRADSQTPVQIWSKDRPRLH